MGVTAANTRACFVKYILPRRFQKLLRHGLQEEGEKGRNVKNDHV